MGSFQKTRNFGSEIFSSSPALNKKLKSAKNMPSSSSFVVSTSKVDSTGTRLEIVKNPERPTLELKITPRKFPAKFTSDHNSICSALSVPHTPVSTKTTAARPNTEKLRVSADFLLRIHNAEVRSEQKSEEKKSRWWRLGSRSKPAPKKSLSLNSRCDVTEKADGTGGSVWQLREDDEVPWKKRNLTAQETMGKRYEMFFFFFLVCLLILLVF